MARAKPWEHEWVPFKAVQIKRGGQGTATVVFKRDDNTHRVYVLKTLNRQKDAERRRRMHREVSSLRTLDHSGIPRVVATNVEKFADSEVPLYFVQDYVAGRTLEEYAADETVLAVEAIRLTVRLLDILKYCHERGIYHRDVKPDNIIVRNDDIEFPVLVDFGQSFNKEERNLTSLTPDEQHLGNRFLLLPELTAPGSNRRDPRSDITACCGILFFVLTKVRPTTLMDDASRLPHQRPAARDALAAVDGVDVQKLFRVFDQAFNVHMDYRFQSIEALHNSLMAVEASKPRQENKHTILDRVLYLKNNAITNQEQQRLLNAKQALEFTKREVESTLSQLFSQLGSEFHRISGNYSLKLSTLRLGYLLGVEHELTDTRFTPQFTISVVGTEVLIAASASLGPRAQPVDLVRVPLSNCKLSADQETTIKEFFLQGLEAAFAQ